MYLLVDKPDTLQTEKVHITVGGLFPNRLYTLLLKVQHRYGTHSANATFRSNVAGFIDLKTDAPVRGTYSGADAMGLFMSQRPHEDFPFGGYLRCTPPVPFYYDLTLFDETNRKIDSMVLKKHWMHPLLERIEIDKDGFCGTLFKPPGDGPFPCIIDISGTGGGIHEHKGSMLASEGFVVLCVAFFQYKGLVEKFEDVDVDYFKKPIEFLLEQTYTTDSLGIQGVSFGGTLVDILTTRFPQFKAAVVINGPHAQCSYMNIKEHGTPMEKVHIDDSRLYFINGILATQLCHKSMTEYMTKQGETQWDLIPKHTNFRIVGSMDDLCSSSIHTARYREKKLKETGHRVEVELVNGGHIMEPPYFPHHEFVYAKFQGFMCGYGGEVVLHGKSQERSWANTIAFFKRTLGAPPPMPEWDRQAIVAKPALEEIRSHL